MRLIGGQEKLSSFPNNYIFTEMIANYSHAGIKTVWDGIDFVITFDSNISPAPEYLKGDCEKVLKGVYRYD